MCTRETPVAHHPKSKVTYSYRFPACSVSEVTRLYNSIPNISHQPEKTKANTGNKGRQATIVSTRDPAYINLETAHVEGNVLIKAGISSHYCHKRQHIDDSAVASSRIGTVCSPKSSWSDQHVYVSSTSPSSLWNMSQVTLGLCLLFQRVLGFEVLSQSEELILKS